MISGSDSLGTAAPASDKQAKGGEGVARKKVVADKTEVLKEFTAILRDENSKIAEKIKAAESIIKYAEEAEKSSANPSGVMIVDDVPRGSDGG